jgi:predicted nuclease of predicted toxin-antitoxin system
MIGFYFDEHMRRSVAKGLLERGYTVVMSVDVGMEGKDDDTEHLVYATDNDLAMVTFDQAFAGRTMSRTDHVGLIYLTENMRDNIGKMIEVLAEFAELFDPEKDAGQVFWLG